MPRLSVAVVTLNEDDRLRACLESVVWADEIVVVDAGSSDKTTAIAQARNIVLKELGLEERYVPAADPALQVDVLPDREPLTHLPSPWT